MESYESAQDLRTELTRGEKLLWSGSPRQGLMFRAQDALMIPFNLLFTVFVIYMLNDLQAFPPTLFFRVWTVLFVLQGVYITVGRFFVESWVRSRTAYGVTDRRVLIVRNLLKRNVRSLGLHTLPEMAISRRGDGGTITFGRPTGIFGASGGNLFANSVTPFSALEIASDAQRVYEIILSAHMSAEPEVQGSGFAGDVPFQDSRLPDVPQTDPNDFWSKE